jgi:hypothetical protein
MMRAITVAAAGFAALGAYALADGGKGEGEGDGKRGTTVQGVVKAVAPGSITIAGRKKEGGQVTPDQTFKVAADAKIMVTGAAAKLADVKVNQPAVLTLNADKSAVVGIVQGARKGREGGEKGDGNEKAAPKKPEGNEKAAPKKPENGNG